MRQAVRAIIIRDGNILLIHRNKFGKEYYTLPGGGIDPGETPEQALAREIAEETGFELTSARLVFVESQGDPWGRQHIFVGEATGSKPALSEQTEEYKTNELGQDLHTPLWLSLQQLPEVVFRTPELQQAILLGAQYGFPEQPTELTAAYLEKVRTTAQTRERVQ